MNRINNSIKNAVTAIVGQLLNNVLRLVCRTVFVYTLGKDYLGISSLYANILTILSVSELGFSSAITYSLYRPLTENNIPMICSLMRLFKKAYQIIGFVILGLGLCLMPFLPYLMNGTTEVVNIYLYYLLYLVQAVISYLFFAYKGTLLIADQKKYLNDVITYIVQIAMNIVQIGVLIFLHSFLLYTVATIVSNVVQNMVIAWMTDKKYPYLKQRVDKLPKEQEKIVFSQVYAMSLYRISTIVGTATDNLVISANISVLMVGLYDNYYMIIQVIQKLISGFFQAFTSSLGNYYVLESKEHNEFVFRCLNLLNSWLIVFCSVCFMVLLQPFIRLWIGETYLLSYPVVIVIVMNFATNYMQSVVQIYKDASGLFVRGKYRAVATAVLNLGVSIILVRFLGIIGVFLGSIISRMATTWWYDAWLLYWVGFGKSPLRYYAGCFMVIALILSSSVLIQLICAWIPVTAWAELIVRGISCVVIVNSIYFLLYRRSEEWRYLMDKGKRFLGQKLLSKQKGK